MIGALSLLESGLDSSAAVPFAPSVQSAPSVGAGGAAKAGGAAGAEFGRVLAEVSADAANALKAGEAAAISGLRGEASVRQVVEAVMSAEQSLHTAVAIRDKVVGAYQALVQMAI